jgi:hypothetical protein
VPVFIDEIRVCSAKMCNGLGASRRTHERVDLSIGAGADAICGPPLFLIARTEILPQKQDGSL